MPSALPSSVPFLVIGAGVHGLSTAWHLAQRGERVLVVDKTGVAAGASGIACGVVRNNYFQPAMSELMAACMDIWESDPEAFTYHGSGYVALGPAAQEPDLVEVAERHERIGYPSELICGEAAVAEHMRAMFPDWRAEGPDRLPARAARRLRVQPRVDARAGRQGARGGRGDRRGRRGHGLRARRRRRGHARAHARGRHRRRAGRRRRRARGSPACGRCWGCRPASTCTQPDGERGAPTGRCGRTGTCRRARSPSTRARSRAPTGRPPRCCTSTPTRRCTTTTAAWSRTSRGATTSSPTGSPSRAAPRPSPSAPSSRSTRIPPAPSTRASPTCGRPPCRTAWRASPARGRATARSARAASARSRPTTSPSSTTWRRTSTWPPTPTTATR